MGSVFQFAGCTLDPARRELVRDGIVQAVEPQVLDLILHLVEHRERVVNRDELMDRIWHGRIVTLSTLNSRIKSARQALGDNGRDQALLRTLHGRGFRFVGAVRVVDASQPAHIETDLPPAGGNDGAPMESRSREPALVALEEALCQLTVVRCSLSDSALSLGTLDPEAVADFLSRAIAVLVETFSALGGHVAQTYPAGVLVYFGWPKASEDAAHLAVEAAIAAGPALARLSAASGLPAEVRVGIATGTVLVGGVGSGDEGLAVGHAPMLAARLLEFAGSGEIVLSETTRALIGGTFVLEEVKVRGVNDPGARIWRVAGPANIATRFAARSDIHLISPVGRDEELALLRRRWQRACEGEGQVLLISGDAGIGKSRLVHACAEMLNEDDYWPITIQCVPHHENSPLYPVIRAFERWVGLKREDTAAVRDARIRQLPAADGGWKPETMRLISELMAPTPEDGAMPAAPLPEQTREQTLDTLAGMFHGLSRQRPALVLVEDAQWIDPTTAELLHRIVDLSSGAAMLVLVTHRPGFAPEWTGWPHVCQLALSHLTSADAARMAQLIAGDARLSERVLARIAARTDGVPLYIEELTRAILAMRRAGPQGPAINIADIPDDIPATLHDLLRSQLDRLGEAGEVARIGAAIGRSFDRDLLGRIVDLPAPVLEAALDRLAASGLVFATGAQARDHYVFKHLLVQDAAYQGLTSRRRRRLHAQIARALEARAAEGDHAEPEILARHFEAADQPEEAFVRWRQAGANAAARYAHAEAVAQFRRALALLERKAEDDGRRRREAELLRQLGPSMIASLGDGHPDVQAVYARFETLCDVIGNDRFRCDALFGLSQFAQVCDPVERSLVISDRYVEVARRVDDGRQLAIAHWIRAQDYWRAGRFAEGLAEARRGRQAFDAHQSTGDLLEHPDILNRTVEAYCASMLGDVGTAVADLRRMADAAASSANPLSPKRTLTVLGVTLQLLGMVDATAAVARRLADLSRTQGWRDQGGWDALLRAWVLAMAGDAAASIGQATRSMDAMDRKSRRPRRLSILADSLGIAGRHETAQELVAMALQESEARGERFWDAELTRQRGELTLAQGGAADRAAADFELAGTIARAQGSRLFELKAAVSLGRVRRGQGRGREAAALVAPVLPAFLDTFDFPVLSEARRLDATA